ncbi:MAG: BlaI/MecI/CopY family transcriptional regulator [Opitutaceae bacterium]
MKPPVKLTRSEMELMEPLWRLGEASIREVLESLSEDRRPEYTTVQTMIYRMEQKGAVKRVKKVGNAHVFAAAIPKKSAVGTLIDQLVDHLGGSPVPLISHLVETGRISLKDIKEVEEMLAKKRKP